MDTTVCSQCGNPRPVVRKPANLRQALWGGWTCPYCENEFDRFGRLLTPQAPSTASDPGGLTISDEKLRVLKPELYGFFRNLSIRFGLDWDQLGYLREHLQNGDARAAVVVSVDPLRVAAYTDELDAVALLEFPPEFVEDYGLRVGSRLLTVNGYVNLHEPAA
ncbi:MAG TPA: hypothetical protein VFT74_14325, partial [Isosphaeraceae bacterium]|nr:hypothetical protein [Isosphaeraceae bacterium]